MTQSTMMPAKDPDAVLDYAWDWTEWLADSSDTISSATVTVSSGITKDTSSASSTAVVVWLSGGTAGQKYTATCHITTTGGRQDDRTLTIPVKQR